MNIGIPIALVLVLSLGYRIFTKNMFENYIYSFLLLLFTIFLFLGSLYSGAPSYGQQKSFTLLIFIVLAACVAKFVILNIKSFLIFNLFFFALFMVAYFSFYGTFGGVLRMTLAATERGEVGGEVFSVISTSQYIGFNLIGLFFILSYLKVSTTTRYIIFSILFAFGFTMMVLFASKGPILSLIMAPLVFILLHKRISAQKVTFLLFTILGMGFLLLYPENIIQLIPIKYQDFFESRFFNYAHYVNGGRPYLLKLAISDIEQKSLLFGKGTGNFGFLLLHKDIKVYPHNIFIELIYENGIFGLLFFIYILSKHLFVKRQFNGLYETNTYLKILVYYFLFCSQVSGDLANNYAIFVFLILLDYHVQHEARMSNILRMIKYYFQRMHIAV
ncbi:O-antigen ligase family protein [uncultured Draconibacterium sp.]|uniref:O-antigen ligase family protein n=1 Tax=uncultured Draconibacterium sp. TaxID=1573823 RepID=UPI0029C5FE8B|nr:O-antigen ligase family protein [uncultured Draconibacterium sp.]